MPNDFFLTPSRDGSSYFLKREGELGSMEFVAFSAALSYARLCPASETSKLVLYDAFGTETMRFPAKTPEKVLAATNGHPK